MRFNELQCKEVININTGCKIGHVCDVVLDNRCLNVIAFIVLDTSLFKRINVFKEFSEFKIDITRVVSIGKDVILVDLI